MSESSTSGSAADQYREFLGMEYGHIDDPKTAEQIEKAAKAMAAEPEAEPEAEAKPAKKAAAKK